MNRKSSLLLLFLGVLTTLTMLSLLDARLRNGMAMERLERTRQQVKALELTDLSLFTEARYTRHLSQADHHTPFQEHPLALEHFPSGSLLLPPFSRNSTK